MAVGTNPRLFLSFTSKDRDIVRPLFARLEAQPVELWNYADEAQEIPGGDTLDQHLRDRIERSEYFLPLVTPNSVQNANTILEVRHALRMASERRLRIIPILSAGEAGAAKWPDPYDRLQSLRYRQGDLGSRQELEDVVESLCRDMGVEYYPLLHLDPRLPFMDRFDAELKRRCPRRQGDDVAVYNRLAKILLEFQTAFGCGDFPTAISRITLFVAMCEYTYPTERFYYPYIAKAVCEINAGQTARASETLEVLRNHPDLDENFYGALGFVRQRQGLQREALAFYRKAAEIDPDDAAAHAGVLLNALESGECVDVDSMFQRLDAAKVLAEEDRFKISALKAYALAATGREDEACKIYEQLIASGVVRADVLINYADCLSSSGKFKEARKLLARHVDGADDPEVLYALARLCSGLGDTKSAVGYFQRLVRDRSSVRKYRTGEALALWRAGRKAEARTSAWTLFDRPSMSLPALPDDYYQDGLANWLLDRRELAEYDFTRSGYPDEHHYRRVV